MQKKGSLGPIAEYIIAEDNEGIKKERQRLREAEKQLKKNERISAEKQKAAAEVQNVRNKTEQTQAKINALEGQEGSRLDNENELQRLKLLKKKLSNRIRQPEKRIRCPSENSKTKRKRARKVNKIRTAVSTEEGEKNTVEERLNGTKSLDKLREREGELKRKNEDDKEIIENEDTSPSDREAAQARFEEELERLAPQVTEREEQMPLREKLKEIFKKYKWSVALVFAVGTTIAAVLGPLLRSLKSTGENVGDGVKTLGKQIASILPINFTRAAGH